MSGDEKLNRKTIFLRAVVPCALIISLSFNLHYYVNLRTENENVVNTMRTKALAVYGSEVAAIAYFLEEYLNTLNLDLIDKEVSWGIARAEWEAGIFMKGLDEDSGLMYYELSRTAKTLENYFVWNIYGPLNATKIETMAQLLSAIGAAFTGFDHIENQDPLKHLGPPSVDEVINYCRQIQAVVQ